MKRTPTEILCAIFFLAALLLLSGTNLTAEESLAPHDAHCDIHKEPCRMEIGDCIVTLDIAPKPVKAMEELAFTVTVGQSCSEEVPLIDLSMPGMVMGENKVILKKTDEGTFQGTGVIVRCPSGKRTWKATVIIPGKGSAEYIFDAIY